MDPNYGWHRPPAQQPTMPLQETENQIQRACQVSCTPRRNWAGCPESARMDFGLITHTGVMPSPSWKRHFLQNQGHHLSQKPGVDRPRQMWVGPLGMPDTSLRPGCTAPSVLVEGVKLRDCHESGSTPRSLPWPPCASACGVLGHLGSNGSHISSLCQWR